MIKIIKNLQHSEKSALYMLYFSYLLNFIVIALFVQFAFGQGSDTFQETLDPTTAHQIAIIFSSIVTISLISIMFFQWIINMIQTTLFNQRKDFNTNMRLAGATRKDLAKIYRVEVYKIQPLIILVGIGIAKLVSLALDSIFEYEGVLVISIPILSTAILIHFISIMFTTIVTVSRLTKFSIIQSLRNEPVRIKRIGIHFSYVIRGIAGLLILTFSSLFLNDPNFLSSEMIGLIRFLLISLTLGLFSDLMLFGFNKILFSIVRRLKVSSLIVMTKITEGYHRKIRSISIMLVMGVTLAVGLQSLYLTVRNDAIHAVMSGIHYTDRYYFGQFDIVPNINTDNFDEMSMFKTIDVFMETENGFGMNVLGVDESFFDIFETITFNEYFSENIDFRYMLSNEDSNGILMPAGYVSLDNIGNTYTFYYEGKPLEFTLIGIYYPNHIARPRILVNRTYLQNVLNKAPNEANIIFTRNVSLDLELNDTNILHTTLLEEARIAYDGMVQGAEIIVIASFVIFVVALLMLVSFYTISAAEIRIDIVRFVSIGFSFKKTMGIYISQILIVTISNFVISLPLILYFANVGRGLFLANFYINSPALIPWGYFSALFIITILISLFTFLVSVRNTFKSAEKRLEILRQI